MYKTFNDILSREPSDHAQTFSGSRHFPKKIDQSQRWNFMQVNNQPGWKDLLTKTRFAYAQ